MLQSSRVMNVPGIIDTDDTEFVGNFLGIPPLREQINSMTGNVSYSNAILLAEELFIKSRDDYFATKTVGDGNSYGKTYSWGNNLKRFIKLYSDNAGSLLPLKPNGCIINHKEEGNQ